MGRNRTAGLPEALFLFVKATCGSLCRQFLSGALCLLKRGLRFIHHFQEVFMHRKLQNLSLLIAALVIFLITTTGLTLAKPDARPAAAPQAVLGNGFTYQGQLTDGGDPAQGVFDFQFVLFDTAAVGTGTLQGSVTAENVTVVDGLFTVALDFGAGAFAGDARWLACPFHAQITCQDLPGALFSPAGRGAPG
jgi:hypothetical protein